MIAEDCFVVPPQDSLVDLPLAECAFGCGPQSDLYFDRSPHLPGGMGGGVPTALNKALLATGKNVITR